MFWCGRRRGRWVVEFERVGLLDVSAMQRNTILHSDRIPHDVTVQLCAYHPSTNREAVYNRGDKSHIMIDV
jgi:hypothetical protein